MVNRKYSNTVILFLVCVSAIMAEYSSSNNTYFPFLKMDLNSKISALGGSGVAMSGRFATDNPASMSAISGRAITVSYKHVILDAMGGELSFVSNSKDRFAFGTRIHYLSYGELTDLSDENNNPIDGTIKPISTDISFGLSKKITENVSLGGELKYIYSKLSDEITSDIKHYSADAFALNIGGIYDVNKNISLGIMIKNLGIIRSHYKSDDGATLPVSFTSGAKIRLGRGGDSHLLFDMNKTLGDYLKFKTGLNFDLFKRYVYARLGFSFTTEDVKNIFNNNSSSSGNVATSYTTDKSDWSLFSVGLGFNGAKYFGLDTSLNFRTNKLPPQFSLALNLKI